MADAITTGTYRNGGLGGSYAVTAAATITGNFNTLEAFGAVVITEILDQDGEDMSAELVQGGITTSYTMDYGEKITCRDGKSISSVTISSTGPKVVFWQN